MRAFKSQSSMKAAIKKEGLHLMNYEPVDTERGWIPRFFTHSNEDTHDIQNRGFFAVTNPQKADK